MRDDPVISHSILRSVPSIFPNLPTQTTYGITGGFAGLCTLPIEYTFQSISASKPPHPASFLRAHLPSGLYRPAIRFWVFSLTRSILQQEFPSSAPTVSTGNPPISVHVHTALIGGLAGASGGFSEVLIQSVVAQRKLPTFGALLNQSSKLFLCFGTYTLVSARYSTTLPPRPFWKCWSMGAVAGALGSAVMAGFEGARGTKALATAAGKGACVIGTVISVQVTSCRWVLDRMGLP